MKKLLSIMLSILMVVTMLPMAVMPASAAENLDYNIKLEVVDWAVYDTSGELIGEFNAVEHGDAFYDVSLTQADDGTFTCSYQIALERNGGNTAWDESSISFKIDSCEDEFMQEFEKSFYSRYNIFYNLKVTRSAGDSHTFKDATCVAPKTCAICGVTEGDIDATAHSWANLDGICANGCGLECTHENQTGETCEICGADIHLCSYNNGFCTECDAYEPAELKDGYYQIKNGGNLFWYANYINTVDRTANAVLTADIDLENRPWTPIGATGENSNNFRGIFDGQNYTIRGLYAEGGRAGLGFFGEVRTGTVKNFTIYGEVVVNTEVNYVGGVIGSVCGVNGENDLERNGAIIQNIRSFVNLTAKAHGVGMIGGFVGYANHQSLIENCSWYGTFDAGKYRVDSGAGGFIGKIRENSSEVTIRNCAAYGTIKTNYAGDYNDTATIYMGGFLSFSNTNAKTTLENCLFAGKFERGANLTDEAFLGAFGTLRSVNAIKNCYYLGDDGLEAVHSDSPLKPGSDNVEITKATEEQLKSGEIAYKLQEANEIWGQSIGTDAYPSFTGGTVYQVENCKGELGYSNTNENIGHQWVNGTCTVCDLVCGHSGGTTKPTDNGDGTHSFTCGDCGAAVAEEHAFDENGTCVCGVNLFSVSGSTLTIDGTLGGKTTATEDDVNALVEQLKGYVDSGITTIIVTGSEPALYNFYGIDTSAVSAALYYLADGRSDSPYCGTIDLILPDVTEIVDDEFNNTFALNSITLPKVTTVGDGAFYATTFLQTLTFGSVITFVNEKNSGPFHMDGYEVGGCDLVLNCGQLQAEDKYKPNFETNVWFIGDWSGEYEWKSITLTHTGGEATCVAKAVCETCGEEYGDIDATAHSWANLDGICANGCGATCAHENQTGSTCEICGAELHVCDFSGEWKYDADKHWKECDCGLISEEGTHTGGTATCTEQAECQHCGASYGEVDKTNHDETVAYVNGFCPNCDAFEPAKLVDGVYEISNAGNLYWFADKVTNENAAYGSADAILTCDIRVNEGTMTEASTGARVWTPIGKLGFIDNKRVYYPYTGTFDGQGNTVSGLYFNDTSANFSVGLFSLVGEGGKVQNVGIADSYLCGGNNVGAVVGNNSGTVTGCYNTGIVSGSSYVGGVVSANGGTVENCYNTGTVSGKSVGGVVGSNRGTVTGCYNTGTVSGSSNVGGVVGHNEGTVTGCYNTGTVSGSSDVGGVVGKNYGTVTGCYNTGTGTVSGSSNVGGVVGHNWTAVTNCYNTGTVSGTTNIGGVVGNNIVNSTSTGTVTNCYFDSTVYTGNAIGNDSGTATDVEGKSTAQFAGGEVAYLLSQGENGSIWGQDLDNGKPVQTTPTFNGAKVYCGYTSCGDTVAKYTNDETISAEKPDHTQKPTFTDNGDGTHSAFYSCCGTTVTEDHTGGTATCKEQAKCEHCGASYGEVDSDNHELDENGKCNDCKTQFVACTAIDGEVKYYETLNDAFYAVENCSAEDNAVVQLLSDIALGSSRGYIYYGEFTFDLAGHKITAEHVALEISGNSEVNPVVILTDSSEAQTGGLYIEKEGGPEPGYQYVAVSVFQATVTIEKGTYSTDGLGGNPVVVSMGDVTVNGGTFYGLVGADYQGSMDIYGGTFINTEDYGYCVNSGFEANVNIYDGEFTSSGYDSRALISISGNLTVYGGTFTAETCLTANDKNITLKIAEGKTEGAKFINGLKAYYSIDGVTLADSLAEGVAYWQGDKMVVLTEGQTEITDGDVVIKAECPHESYSDGACDVCGAECTHDNQTGAVCEICGAELHICDFSGEWKYDADKHWKECTADGCDKISEESEHSYTDGNCACGYTCPHEWGEGVLTRPERVTTTDWDDGYYTYTCSLCGHYYQETVKRADYAAYDAVSDDYYAIIMNSSVLGSVKDALKDAVDSLYQNHADVMAGDRIESEQEAVDKVVAEFEKLVSDAEEKIASGEYVKGDYTAIDEAIDDIEEKLASENVTDEGKAELEEIKKQLEEMKADENTSAADVAELEKALEDYEAELDKGIADGTLVMIRPGKIGAEFSDKWKEWLEAEGLTDEYKDFIDNQKATGEALAAEKEINEFLASLEGTVAENAENIAKLNEMLNSFTASFENCLRGTHNFKDYEVTSPAKCEVNAIETSTCWFCGETDEREVEGTALSHSFTKYEETEAPKCGVAGKEVATCDNGCGATDEKEIPALEHVFIDYASNGDATCTSDGTKTASCIYGCGATDTVADEGSKLPHVDEDGDKLCDDCGGEVVDICPDCGLRAHADTGVPEYICLLITFIRLIVPFIKTVIAVL